MTDPVLLVVGLGNPGREYEDTRHNVGAWYVDALARRRGVSLSEDKKSSGLTGHFSFEGNTVRLLIPTTFMNLSGQSTAAVANFFKIPVQQILVAHDELDLPPGTVRLKKGGGHGGHNGLRDMISKHGNQKDFLRLTYRMAIDDIKLTAKQMHEMGWAKKDHSADIEKYVDFSFLEKATGEPKSKLMGF